jgi:hypothetical protein
MEGDRDNLRLGLHAGAVDPELHPVEAVGLRLHDHAQRHAGHHVGAGREALRVGHPTGVLGVLERELVVEDVLGRVEGQVGVQIRRRGHDRDRDGVGAGTLVAGLVDGERGDLQTPAGPVLGGADRGLERRRGVDQQQVRVVGNEGDRHDAVGAAVVLDAGGEREIGVRRDRVAVAGDGHRGGRVLDGDGDLVAGGGDVGIVHGDDGRPGLEGRDQALAVHRQHRRVVDGEIEDVLSFDHVDLVDHGPAVVDEDALDAELVGGAHAHDRQGIGGLHL